MIDMSGQPLAAYSRDVTNDFALHLAEISMLHFVGTEVALDMLAISYPPDAENPQCWSVPREVNPDTFVIVSLERVAEASYHTRLGMIFSLMRNLDEFGKMARNANIAEKDFPNTFVFILLVGGQRTYQFWIMAMDGPSIPVTMEIKGEFFIENERMENWGHLERDRNMPPANMQNLISEMKRGLREYIIPLPSVEAFQKAHS